VRKIAVRGIKTSEVFETSEGYNPDSPEWGGYEYGGDYTILQFKNGEGLIALRWDK
jgi:hypothetical protein